MAFVYHASDTDSDCDEGLEFGNVALARSFGQMAPQEPVPASQQRLRGAAGQRPAEPDIDSLPDWDPATVTPAALHAGGVPAERNSWRAAAGGRRGTAGSDAMYSQPLGVQWGGQPHGRSASARLLQQSEYGRKNSATPPPLPAPPDWLRGGLGSESPTERFLRGGQTLTAAARSETTAVPDLPRQLRPPQLPVPKGSFQLPEAAPSLPTAVQPPGATGSSSGAGPHLTATRAPPRAKWRSADGDGASDSTAHSPASRLHHELMRFATQAVPSRQEAAAVREGLAGIRAVAQLVWPESTANLFGSQATGLALPGADLDVVVLGAHSELQTPAQGYSHEARSAISGLLEDLLDALRAAEPPVLLHTKRAQIIRAKVPIIKCTLAAGGGIPADISLGTANGVGAAQYINRQLSVLPMLRPLILAVKAYLREKGLNEARPCSVFCGGLSSYTVASMCMAHLQAEGLAAAVPATAASPDGSAQPAVELRATAAAAGAALDAGYLLHSLFTRFGYFFKYEIEAVSVRRGGITAKLPQWRLNKRKWLLAVEDPQEQDKDIAQGSFSIRQVKSAFKAAAAKLQAAGTPATTRQAAKTQAEAAAWAQVQADGQSRSTAPGPGFPILQTLFDANLVLSRDTDAAAKRTAAAAAASRKARLDGLKVGTKARRKMGLAPDGTPLPPKAPRGGKFRVKTQQKRQGGEPQGSEVNGHGGQYRGGRRPVTKGGGGTPGGGSGKAKKGRGKHGGQQQGGQKVQGRKKRQQKQGKLLGQRAGGVHKK